ncbi:hypothetical protein ACH5RR_008268 [Cinchona calisaya]|uniref:Uncharacterized protein n=1 Tax=Cinchona calisaya TaxID=153742 RepID=A0ABD3AAW1_9GENT
MAINGVSKEKQLLAGKAEVCSRQSSSAKQQQGLVTSFDESSSRGMIAHIEMDSKKVVEFGNEIVAFPHGFGAAPQTFNITAVNNQELATEANITRQSDEGQVAITQHTSTAILELDVEVATLHVCAIGTAQEEEFAAVFQEEKMNSTSCIDVSVAALTCRKETLTPQSKSDVTAATDSPHGVVSALIGSNKDPKQVQQKRAMTPFFVTCDGKIVLAMAAASTFHKFTAAPPQKSQATLAKDLSIDVPKLAKKKGKNIATQGVGNFSKVVKST